MRLSPFAFVLILLAAGSEGRAQSVQEQAPMTPRSALLGLMVNASSQVVDHCNRRVPGNAEALSSAFGLARRSMELASRDYFAELSSEADQPLDAETIRAWYRATDAMFDIAQRAEPKRYCTWLTGNLIEMTPEKALRAMREGYGQAKARNERERASQ